MSIIVKQTLQKMEACVVCDIREVMLANYTHWANPATCYFHLITKCDTFGLIINATLLQYFTTENAAGPLLNFSREQCFSIW